MTVEPDSMHRSFGGNVDHCSISCCPTVVDLASNFDVYSLPEVHATGSTVLLASKLQRCRNVITRTSRRGGTYVNIVYHEVTIPFVVTRLKSISFAPRFWLSALPAQTFDVVALQEYVALMKCQPCHSRLVLLRAKS